MNTLAAQLGCPAWLPCLAAWPGHLNSALQTVHGGPPLAIGQALTHCKIAGWDAVLRLPSLEACQCAAKQEAGNSPGGIDLEVTVFVHFIILCPFQRTLHAASILLIILHFIFLLHVYGVFCPESSFCTAHCTLSTESTRSLPTSPDGTQQQPSGPTAEYRTLQTISHAGRDTISARSSLTSDLLQPKLAKTGQPPNQLLRRRPAAIEGPEPAARPTNQNESHEPAAVPRAG